MKKSANLWRRNVTETSASDDSLAFSDERDLFELGYAARLNRGTGLYFGWRPYRRTRT